MHPENLLFLLLLCMLLCVLFLVVSGNAAGVVLWDVRTQEAVGTLPAFRAGSRHAASSSPRNNNSSSNGLMCVGVQLDDWRLVSGFTQSGSSSGGGGCGGSSGGGGAGGGGNAGAGSSSGGGCWWHSSGEAWGGDDGGGYGPGRGSGHSLEVYDIRAAASYSSAAAAADASGSSGASAAATGVGSGSGKLWSAQPVMSLPVPNRITCFQVCVCAGESWTDGLVHLLCWSGLGSCDTCACASCREHAERKTLETSDFKHVH